MADAVAAAQLPIVEIFHSIQGEGSRVGEPATFVRLAGCNLRCSWCDTPYSWSAEGLRTARKQTLEEVASTIREQALVITGGEPMLHAKHLLEFVQHARDAGVQHITIETNGTIVPEPELATRIDLWSVSPKLPGSGEPFPTDSLRDLLARTAGRVQLKFVVVDTVRDYEAMWSHLTPLLGQHELERREPIIVQPDGTRTDYDAALRELAEHVSADDRRWSDDTPRRSLVRVIPQVHRVAWGPAARGV